MLGLTLAFVCGTLLGAHTAIPAGWLLGAAWLLLAVLVAATWRGAAFATPLVHATVAALAWCHVAMLAHNPSRAELGARWGHDGRHLRAVVEVVDDPVAEAGRDGRTTVWRFPARLRAMEDDRWRRATGRLDVWLESADTASAPRFGERWLLSGAALVRPSRPAAPPDYRFTVQPGSAQRLSGPSRWSLRRWCLEGRRACAEILAAGVSDYPETVGLVRALMLGYRHELPARAEDAFRRTGTLHIVAISGAHVGMVAMFFLVLLKATGCPQPRWILVLGPLLLIYALGTGMSASALRACIMAVAFWSAYLFRRQPDGPSALALSALVILSAVPGQLWEAGFLLSFVVVGGLLVLYPVLAQPLQRLAARDPWQVQQEGPVRRAARWVGRQAGSLVAVTVAAWLVSTPLIAGFFNLFSPVALLANLVVVPMAFVILLAACLSVLAGGPSPALASVFNHANRVFVDALLRVVDFFHQWPGGHWFVQAPPPWLTAAWFIIVLTLALGRLRWRLAAAAGVVAVLAVCWGWRATDHRIRCVVTPMGDTQVVFCNLPGSDDWLIDTGPARFHRRLLRFLRAQGVDRLQVLVLSRASLEAGGGALDLLAALPVREVWIPDAPGRSPAFAGLIDEIERRGVTVRRLARGDHGTAAGGLQWQALHPERQARYASSGQAGLSLHLARNAASLLFMSQASAPVEDELLRQPLDWGAGALVVGALEDERAAGAPWLAALRPAVALLPPHTQAQAGSGIEAVVARLQDAGSRVEVLPADWMAHVDLPVAGPRLDVNVRELEEFLR